MRQETKILIGIGIFTVLIFAGILWYASKTGNSGNTVVDSAILTRPDSQKISAPNAKVTLVEFGDYQCPACGAMHPIVKQLLKDYEGRINFVYRNFPLPQHQYAVAAANAAETAGDQGKFWEMFDVLFERQQEWVNSKTPADLFEQYSKNLGMDVDKFSASLKADKYSEKIQRDRDDGNLIGIDATPTFFLNGRKLIFQNAGDIKNAIDAALKNVR